ncbi:hypothetical protein EJB05_14027, partial [Eragrostis curvula]
MGATPNATARPVLSIAADGQLTLTDGRRELWRASTTSMQRGSVLVLRDSGNAQFLSDDGAVLWESFGYPMGTLLPCQSLKGFLFSKCVDSEFTTGRFSLAAQRDGNVVLCIDFFTGDILENAYWATGTNGPEGNTTVTFDDKGGLSYTLYDGTVNSLISPRSSGRDMPVNSLARYLKHGMQGMCGPGSYCVETRERLSSLCSSCYTYVDSQHSDSGGAVWEYCLHYKRNVLRDCFCLAALMMNGSDCAEVGALAYRRQGNDIGTTALIKVRNTTSRTAEVSSLPSSTRTRMIRRLYMMVTICLPALFLVGSLVAQYYCLTCRNRSSQQPLSSSVRAFSWKELYRATDGFKELLGKGSFGEVYKGRMRSPEPHLIAVKRLSEQEFTNEVQSIGQIHHRNLVRMIGYCKQGKHRMLVFEFMPGGSLRSFLFNSERRPPRPWRAEAALAPIIHCDIKPDNVLLDDLGISRITDFGISKLLGSQQVHTTATHIRGTRGYIAPEWLRGDARVDTKVDVYIFGVVLLEMICCRRCQEPVEEILSDVDNDDETVTLITWAA